MHTTSVKTSKPRLSSFATDSSLVNKLYDDEIYVSRSSVFGLFHAKFHAFMIQMSKFRFGTK